MINVSNDGQMICLRNCEVFKTNFTGNEERRNGQIVNNEGARYFLVWLDEDDAKELEADNWALKWTKPRPDSDPDYRPRAYMKINVAYPRNYPKLWPKIVLHSGEDKINIYEDTVEQIDHEDITSIKVEFRARVNRDTGIKKAYAATIYVYVRQDPFANDDDLFE
jgi:hypothetical protein